MGFNVNPFDLTKEEEMKLEHEKGTVLSRSINNARSSFDYFTLSLRHKKGDAFLVRITEDVRCKAKYAWLQDVKQISDTEFRAYRRSVDGVAAPSKNGQKGIFKKRQVVDWAIWRGRFCAGAFTELKSGTRSTAKRD